MCEGERACVRERVSRVHRSVDDRADITELCVRVYGVCERGVCVRVYGVCERGVCVRVVCERESCVCVWCVREIRVCAYGV